MRNVIIVQIDIDRKGIIDVDDGAKKTLLSENL